jgi:hypothetical protein
MHSAWFTLTASAALFKKDRPRPSVGLALSFPAARLAESLITEAARAEDLPALDFLAPERVLLAAAERFFVPAAARAAGLAAAPPPPVLRAEACAAAGDLPPVADLAAPLFPLLETLPGAFFCDAVLAFFDPARADEEFLAGFCE